MQGASGNVKCRLLKVMCSDDPTIPQTQLIRQIQRINRSYNPTDPVGEVFRVNDNGKITKNGDVMPVNVVTGLD